MRWEPKRLPPVPAHGLAECTGAETEAWAESSYALSPYQFQRRSCLRRPDGTFDVLSVGEQERIMGMPSGYTAAAVPSSKAKADKRAAFAVRASLCGNAMHVRKLEWILCQLAVELGYP